MPLTAIEISICVVYCLAYMYRKALICCVEAEGFIFSFHLLLLHFKIL